MKGEVCHARIIRHNAIRTVLLELDDVGGIVDGPVLDGNAEIMGVVNERFGGKIEKAVESHGDLKDFKAEFCIFSAVKEGIIEVEHFGDACRADDFLVKSAVCVALIDVLGDFALERTENGAVDDVVFFISA